MLITPNLEDHVNGYMPEVNGRDLDFLDIWAREPILARLFLSHSETKQKAERDRPSPIEGWLSEELPILAQGPYN
jgi:hypothetical protein